MYELAQRAKGWSGWYGPGTYDVGLWRECQITSFRVNGDAGAAYDLWGNDAGSSSVQDWTLIVINNGFAKATCYG
ncbi:hypothetical protein LGM58_41800 [Burkholderia contaminans]|uniref:hypothetical protein n=1 Tax=Burkholderia contaminans TaxID=488447 RepID=UPI001CF35247|nr:hypothetical protein [Burkholderia contaminans]MCA7889716.1 hypothetical protein [Burkholderia contaminans]